MRRFDYDENDDFKEEVDNFFGDMPFDEHDPHLEYEMIMQQQLAIQQAQIGMVYREQDQRLLYKAIKMAEKSFFWRFRSLDFRMSTITKIYETLQSAMREDDLSLEDREV